MDSATPLHKISGISLQVYRYNFDEGFMDELTAFAKLHEHDSRLDFKDAWKSWMSENKELVDAETERLVQLGFAGDVADKMFKSVRYYFRKKSLVPSVQPVRKTYDTLHKPVLVAMDEQIRTQIKINVIETKPDADGNVPTAVSTISPAEGFANFLMSTNRLFWKRFEVCTLLLHVMWGFIMVVDPMTTFCRRYLHK